MDNISEKQHPNVTKLATLHISVVLILGLWISHMGERKQPSQSVMANQNAWLGAKHTNTVFLCAQAWLQHRPWLLTSYFWHIHNLSNSSISCRSCWNWHVSISWIVRKNQRWKVVLNYIVTTFPASTRPDQELYQLHQGLWRRSVCIYVGRENVWLNMPGAHRNLQWLFSSWSLVWSNPNWVSLWKYCNHKRLIFSLASVCNYKCW